MSRFVVSLNIGLVVVLAGCGGSSHPNRSVAAVKACLDAGHIVTTQVQRDTTLLGNVRPRPITLLSVTDALSLIAFYSTDTAAAGIFSSIEDDLPAMQHSNVLVISLITPQPSRAMRATLARCAFGHGVKPSVSRATHPRPAPLPSAPKVASGSRQAEQGRQLVGSTGCLACHRIGSAGNDGPGAPLSAIGDRLSTSAIRRTLLRPTAPMPSFAHLGGTNLDALVTYLSLLRHKK